MKKAVIGAIMLGFAGLSYSQNVNEVKEIKLSNVDVTSTNQEYVDKVCTYNVPAQIIELEKKASRFNIRESMFFDKNSKEFEIYFIAKDGEIAVTYDRNGRILKTNERFENMTFPFEIRNAIHKDYPNWTIHKDTYLVSYDHRKGAEKVYKAQLRKNGAKVNINLGASAERLD